MNSGWKGAFPPNWSGLTWEIDWVALPNEPQIRYSFVNTAYLWRKVTERKLSGYCYKAVSREFMQPAARMLNGLKNRDRIGSDSCGLPG